MDLTARVQRWIPNMRRIEIEITTACNLRCPNCDRSSAQAVSNEYMSAGQIAYFLSESRIRGWEWERITLLGGEPTLHPGLDGIISILREYVEEHPSTDVRLFSNGYGTRVKKTLAYLPNWIEVTDTKKTPSAPLFSLYNAAPIDDPRYSGGDFSRGCVITQWCGLGVTRYGLYPCGAGASIDRIFGWDIGIKTLKEVTSARLLERLWRLCRCCGHYADFDQKIRYSETKNESDLAGWERVQRTSSTWKQAYNRYSLRRPTLSLYGG